MANYRSNELAKCMCCEDVQFKNIMVSVPSPKRGSGNAYMCSGCAQRNRQYHAVNNKVLTKEKMNQVMDGLEIETSFTNEKARLQMFEYGLIPTHDCSLTSDNNDYRYGWEDGTTCEYVTGIMHGLNQASKLCVTIENLMNEGALKMNSSCGVHFHVSINSMKDENGSKIYMSYIERFYHSLFVPLSKVMTQNQEATVQLFGRYFNNYACSISEYSSAGNRYNFINVTNNSNIEFRLNKFVNAKQFQKVMKLEVEMTKTIVNNFCKHFNDEPKDKRRYPDITSYRKHKANIAAQKLVKLYLEAINE